MRKRAESGFLASATLISQFFDASKRFYLPRRQEEPSSRFPTVMDLRHDFARFHPLLLHDKFPTSIRFTTLSTRFCTLSHACTRFDACQNPDLRHVLAHFQSARCTRFWHTTLTPPRFSTSLHTSALIILPHGFQTVGWLEKQIHGG